MRHIVIVLGMAVLVATLLAAGCGGEEAKKEEAKKEEAKKDSTVAGRTFEFTQLRNVIEEKSTSGRSEWRQQVPGTLLSFKQDGTFEYLPPNVRRDLYPIRGRYQQSGGTVNFEGQSGASPGNNANNLARVSGTLTPSPDGTATVRINEFASAATGAVVNKQKTGAITTAQREFEAIAKVRR